MPLLTVLGDSLSSVESLIKKHESFEKSLMNQEGKLGQLKEHASTLLAGDHYESPAIITRRDAVFTRYSRLKQESKQRMKKLHDSKKLQQFLQEVTEVEAWIAEKMQIASEESYHQMTNLQSKLQMHQAFEAELTANQERVDEVQKNGMDLIDSNHYASQQIGSCVDSLSINWQNLLEKSSDKGQKLKQVRELQVFEQEVEDIQEWISDMENQLASQDLGKDLISVNNLLKSHYMLESEIQAHQTQIDDIQAQVRRFVDSNHFMIDRIEDCAREVVTRYCVLEDPMSRRLQQLESSLQLQKFVHEVEEEMNWIREREHQSTSTELGSNLSGVQQLLAKHEVLVEDLKGHEDSIGVLSTHGEDLIRDGHFATKDIQERLEKLSSAWNGLNSQAKKRTTKLNDSLHLQQFYAKATEAESWMRDKHPLVSSTEYGKDEDSTLALIKKHETVQQELESYRSKVDDLNSEGKSMIAMGHYAQKEIEEKQSILGSLFSKLISLAQRRHLRLKETKQLHEFNRECDEFSKWVKEKEVIACAEETGRDLEHVEIVQKRFSDFKGFLESSDDRIGKVNLMGISLIEDKHTNSAHIKKRQATLNAQWEELKRKISQRSMTLEAAKEIHTFNRDANETLQRIKEKEKALSGEDYGKDLSSVHALQKKHTGFEHDLAPLEKRVQLLCKDATKLQSSHKTNDIKEKEASVKSAWRQLKEKSKQREQKLKQALELQRYFDNFRDLSLWLNDMKLVILAEELPQDIAGAEELLQRLSEHKTEIDDHKNDFSTFQSKGKSLVSAKHYAKDEIQEKMSAMETKHKEVLDLWNEKREDCEEHLDILKFKHDAENADSWVAAQEAFFKFEDTGDSLDAVEDMIKKQDELEKMLIRQQERFKELGRETKAERLERDRIEMEEKRIREEREARHREEKRRLEELKKKEEEEQKKREEERKLREEKERKRLEEERKQKEEEKKKQEEKLLQETDDDFGIVGVPTKMPPKKPPQLELSVTTASDVKMKTSESASSGFYDIPPSMQEIHKEGTLQRKNELDEGARKATSRSTKTYYIVLDGTKLYFYKDKKDAVSKVEAAPPINISLGSCQTAKDSKKKHAFRLTLPNGAEYLFVGEDDDDAIAWVTCINNAIQTSSHVYKQAPDLTTQYGAQQSPIKLSGTASKPHQLAVAAAKKLDESSKPMLSATTEKKQAQTTTGAHEGSTQEKGEQEKKKRRFTLKRKT